VIPLLVTLGAMSARSVTHAEAALGWKSFSSNVIASGNLAFYRRLSFAVK
jgi:hypothetical protein